VELVYDALPMALSRRRITDGLIAHSDRGSQYAVGDYQSLLWLVQQTLPGMRRQAERNEQ
jgi:transposase InsO family protein